jgi:hypothetical protein
MNPIEKLKSWIWPEREVKAETPGLPADHQHDFAELPCDMGRKVYRMCRTKGCDFNETVPATAEQRRETAPLANQVRGFQDQVLGDVAEELGRRRKPR